MHTKFNVADATANSPIISKYNIRVNCKKIEPRTVSKIDFSKVSPYLWLYEKRKRPPPNPYAVFVKIKFNKKRKKRLFLIAQSKGRI